MSLTSGLQTQDAPQRNEQLIDALNKVIAMQAKENEQLKARITELERNDQAQMSEIMRLRQLESFRTMGEGKT